MDSRFSVEDSGTTSRRPHSYQNVPGIPNNVKVLGKMGSGTNGSVYRVIDERGKEAAYKVLDTGTGSYIERTIGVDFIREACIYKHIGNRNPGICNVKEIGNGYISMCLARGNLLEEMDIKYKEGDVLRQGERVLQSKVFSLDSILEDMATLLATVDLLHKENITHFDIKPANILRGKDSRLRLCDMGSASVTPKEFLEKFENARKKFLAGGSVNLDDLAYIYPMVTPQYMAPESYLHILNEGDYPLSPLYAGTDIWGLGVTFLELLTGYNFNRTIIKSEGDSSIYGYISDDIVVPMEMVNKFSPDMKFRGFSIYGSEWKKVFWSPYGRSNSSPYELLLQEQTKVGSPNKGDLSKVWKMINKMLDPNPLTRITAEDCLKSPLFLKNKHVRKVIDNFYAEYRERTRVFEHRTRNYLNEIEKHEIPKSSRVLFERHMFGEYHKVYKFMTERDSVLKSRYERLARVAHYRMTLNPEDLTKKQKDLFYFCLVLLAGYAEYFSPLSERPFQNFSDIFGEDIDEMARVTFLGAKGDSVKKQFDIVMYFLLVHVFDFDLWV